MKEIDISLGSKPQTYFEEEEFLTKEDFRRSDTEILDNYHNEKFDSYVDGNDFIKCHNKTEIKNAFKDKGDCITKTYCVKSLSCFTYVLNSPIASNALICFSISNKLDDKKDVKRERVEGCKKRFILFPSVYNIIYVLKALVPING